MSIWTHVAAVFRIDGVREDKHRRPSGNPDWDRVTGRTIYDGDWCTDDTYEQRRMKDDWEKYHKHPQRFVPTGSEGSLQRLVWTNPDNCSLARYTVTVFGDLRNYDDHEAIREWFEKVCSRCYIRQAVCHCYVSGRLYVYECEVGGAVRECRL